jgi:RHS repeat-associated protein
MRTTRSSWYQYGWEPKIWSTQYNDPNLRGANTISWTSTDQYSVFDPIPSGLLSTKTNTFDTYTNPLTKVYNVLLNKQTTTDALTGVTTEDSFTYDGLVTSSSYYGLQTKSISKKSVGSTEQGTATTISSYDNNPTGIGSSFYVGRPKTVTSTISNNSSGDIRTSGVSYTYTGTNLSKTDKTGHNTGYAIVEEMNYDGVGNLLTKTISAPGATSSVAPRTISDEYDTSKRFVVKKTDNQGFITQFTYNSLGQVLTSTNYLGVNSTTSYDSWGKPINSIVYNASTTPVTTAINYTKLSTGGYITTTTNSLNGTSIVEFDVLGREIRVSSKGLAAGSMISKQVSYDGLGRKLWESEPYFSFPNRFTNYEYDHLQRPIKVTTPTGRIQSISYEGLKTTSIDDGKTTTATLDALGNKVETTDPGGVINFKYYADGQLKESNYEGHKVTVTIDGWGNKIAMNDPNAGNYSYTYDAFGQALTETTPKGTTTNTYDAQGKLIKKKLLGDGTDIESDYTYNSLAQLTSETSKNSNGGTIDLFTYGYDNLNRLVTNTESNSRFTQTKSITFDTFSRPITATTSTQEMLTGMVSTVVTKNHYNTYNGMMDKITDGNDLLLWQLNTANEKMQPLTQTLGNGIAITDTYSFNGYFISQKHLLSSTTILHNIYDFNEIKGTLNSRQNIALGITESFEYDNLDRLTRWINPLTGITDSNSYDNRGRITDNNKIGTVNYNTNVSTGIYRKSSISLSPEGKNYYNTLPKQVVSYTMFKSPISINESDKGSTTITYNSHLSRQTMNYGFIITPTSTTGVYTKTKDYTDDGSVEIIKTPATITIRTYVGGDAYSAPLYVEKIKNLSTGAIVDKKFYLHRDYLGSIIAISDENGIAIERRHFDAWGNLAKLQQNNVAVALPTDGTATKLMLLDRGYTSHEHLSEVGLIHMNGRLYDPVLRSFLMPDNFIQQPENTQNYNRYAYVLNNPLMYTDPSGELLIGTAILIGALVSAATYTMTALLADVPFNVGGLLKATFVGAASAAVTFGIGTGAEKLFTNFFSRAAFQAAAHGTFQGSMTAISGGKFWSGFAAGALSSIASSAWGGGTNSQWQGLGGKLADKGAGMIAFGTIAGGAGAKLTGGNFWQGALTGLVVSGLNHAMHKMQESSRLEKAIRTGGYGDELDKDPYLNWTNEKIKEFASKVFPELYKNANSPDFEKQSIIGNNPNIAGQALKEITVDASGKYTVRSLGKILIRSNVLNSIRQLGTTVGHELNHAVDHFSGTYANWANQNRSTGVARSLSEQKATNWEIDMRR